MTTPSAVPIPSVSSEEVAASVERSAVIYLRVTPDEKDAIKAAASALRMSATEYLLKCHELVAGKIQKGE